MLGNWSNKSQLNCLIAQETLLDSKYLDKAAEKHILVVTEENHIPVMVKNSHKVCLEEISSLREEADLIIV